MPASSAKIWRRFLSHLCPRRSCAWAWASSFGSCPGRSVPPSSGSPHTTPSSPGTPGWSTEIQAQFRCHREDPIFFRMRKLNSGLSKIFLRTEVLPMSAKNPHQTLWSSIYNFQSSWGYGWMQGTVSSKKIYYILIYIFSASHDTGIPWRPPRSPSAKKDLKARIQDIYVHEISFWNWY